MELQKKRQGWKKSKEIQESFKSLQMERIFAQGKHLLICTSKISNICFTRFSGGLKKCTVPIQKATFGVIADVIGIAIMRMQTPYFKFSS